MPQSPADDATTSPAEPPAAVESDVTEPGVTESNVTKSGGAASGAADPDVDASSETETEAPLNRAERRAKGKAGKQPPPIGKIQPGRTNQNHGPRQYANRRSG